MRSRHLALLWIAWLVVGLVNGLQDLAVRRVVFDHPIEWWRPLAIQILGYQFWWLLTPAVLAISRAFPLDRDNWRRSLAAHAAGSVLVPAVYLSLCQLFVFSWLRVQPPATVGREWFLSIVGNIHVEFLTYWVIVALHQGVRAYRERRDREVLLAQAQAQLAEARLAALTMQLEPHFLFNALNAVSELIHQAPDLADAMVVQLGDFLRATLEAAPRQFVTLREELGFLERYLAIEKVRFGDRLTVNVHVDDAVSHAMVPAMLLQPLVENAVRHGVSRLATPGRVDVIASAAVDHHLRIYVENTGPEVEVPPRHGVGLTNTAERLRQTFGADHRFDITPRPGGGLVVNIVIPFRPAPAAAGPQA